MSKENFRQSLVDFFNDKGYREMDNAPITERTLFGNWPGLRLSSYGYNLMKEEFDRYVFQVPEDTKLSVKNFLSLNRELRSPYFFYSKRSNNSHVLVLFNQNDYVHLQLVGDFKLWLASIDS
jgi:hypothetical protein